MAHYNGNFCFYLNFVNFQILILKILFVAYENIVGKTFLHESEAKRVFKKRISN
jgi:hypothetical protein